LAVPDLGRCAGAILFLCRFVPLTNDNESIGAVTLLGKLTSIGLAVAVRIGAALPWFIDNFFAHTQPTLFTVDGFDRLTVVVVGRTFDDRRRTEGFIVRAS
jgi:hypothetical protein